MGIVTDSLKKTPRGFCIFGAVESNGMVRGLELIESSLAFEGAHVWLRPNDGQHPLIDAPQLNVEQAKKLRDLLGLFIQAAEAGELTEPASR